MGKTCSNETVIPKTLVLIANSHAVTTEKKNNLESILLHVIWFEDMGVGTETSNRLMDIF